MFPFTHPAACAIATATLLGTIVLASPSSWGINLFFPLRIR